MSENNTQGKIDLTKPGRVAETGAGTVAYVATTAISAGLLTLFGIGRGVVKGAVPAIIDGVRDGAKLGMGKSVVTFPMKREEPTEQEQRPSERKLFGGQVVSRNGRTAPEPQSQIVEDDALPV